METQEQQLEEIKRWWQEHGRTVIAGVVLGLGSVIGWTTWRAHVEASAEELSVRYERLVSLADTDRAGAIELADAIVADHPDSAYAGLAALVAAKAAYDSGDATTARRLLEWAAANAGALEVDAVARIRLARILAEQGEHDAALRRLDGLGDGAFAVLAAEARGDVLAARGDAEAARAAYREALARGPLAAAIGAGIQLKLDALPAAGG